MKDDDIEKIAEVFCKKLQAEKSQRSDEDFAILLAEKLHEHRSPCHDLTEEDIKSIREVLKTAKRLDRGLFWLFVTLAGLILKSTYDFVTQNMQWGP